MSVILFPGQGSQYVGMAKDFYENFDSVKNLFKLASDISGYNCENLLFNSTDDELKETEKTQVAITLANLSAFYALKDSARVPNITAVAGFSLGEYSALAVSGVISVEDCFKLVTKRGELMSKVGYDVVCTLGAVAMAAVIGLESSKIEELLKGRDDLFVANYNSEVQTIISGLDCAIDEIEEDLKNLGAKRVIKLKVSGPFHTPLLLDAQTEFTSYLQNFTFNSPTTHLYSNVSGALVNSADEAKSLIAKQIASSVKWIDIENNLKQNHANANVLEVGPGTVLAGLWKAKFNEIIKNVSNLEHINTL